MLKKSKQNRVAALIQRNVMGKAGEGVLPLSTLLRFGNCTSGKVWERPGRALGNQQERRAELGQAGLCASVSAAGSRFVVLLFRRRRVYRKESNKQISASVVGRKRSHSNKTQQDRFRIDPKIIPTCTPPGRRHKENVETPSPSAIYSRLKYSWV